MQFGQTYPDTSTVAWDAWINMLAPGASPTSSAAFETIARLVALPAAVREAVDTLDVEDDEKSELLQDLDKIEAGFGVLINGRQQIRSMLAHFAPSGISNSAAVRGLVPCSRRLHRENPEPELSSEELQQFADSITALMADVQAASLSAAVKLLLLHHLHAMLQAVQLAAITGIVEVEERLDAFSGALSRQPEALAETTNASFFERLKTFVDSVNVVLRGARGVRSLAIEGAHTIGQGEHLLERGVEEAGRLLGG